MSQNEELLYFIQSSWGNVLNAARKRNLSLEALMRCCHVSSINNETITLAFDYDFHKKKIEEERNLKIIQDSLREVFGKRYNVICALSDPRKDNNQVRFPPGHIPWDSSPSTQVESQTITEQRDIIESPIEEIFWNALSLDDFIVPQFKIGRYRVDFAIPSHKVVIELDGHDFHSSKEQRTNDAQRERWLKLNGWDVLRFTGSEVWKNVDECINQMKRYIERK